MNIETFFSDHWKEIEDERIERYEAMFQWRPGHTRLLEPAAIVQGQRVLDYGSGPGFMAIGIAEIVGDAGFVHGVDVNARFVADATRRAEGRGNVRFHHIHDARIPLDDDSVDRVICKNVLEYVPDVEATLLELFRVLAPGGRILTIDSDWGFVVVEPWGKHAVDAFFEAAAPAFKEPHIGRKLPGLLHRAGFHDVEVEVQVFPDTQGSSMAVLRNMQSYGASFDTMPVSESQALLRSAERAIGEGNFLFCLPQFLVTAIKE